MITAIKCSILCVLLSLLSTKTKAQFDNVIYFRQLPIKNNSDEFRPDLPPTKRFSQVELDKRLSLYKVNQKINLDSFSLFTTSFRYQKEITSLRYNDYRNIEQNINQIVFFVYRNSFFTRTKFKDLVFQYKKYVKNIYLYGPAVIFECSIAYRNFQGKERESLLPSKIVLIFKNESNISQLDVSGLAFSCDSINWQRSDILETDYFSLEYSLFEKFGDKIGQLSIPMLYDVSKWRFFSSNPFLETY